MDASEPVARQNSLATMPSSSSIRVPPEAPDASQSSNVTFIPPPPESARSTTSGSSSSGGGGGTGQRIQLLDSVHNSPPEVAAKTLFKVASELSKYEVISSGGISKKGLLKATISFDDYKSRILILLKTVNMLPCPLAVAVSSYLPRNRDANKVAQRLKEINREFEQRSRQPSESSSEPHTSVFLFDNEAKFAKMGTVFGGDRAKVEELYATDSYVRQCTEIERLLRGEDVGDDDARQAEDDPQGESIRRLTEMLRMCASNDGKLCVDPRFSQPAMEYRR